jgi:hypothetical protein
MNAIVSLFLLVGYFYTKSDTMLVVSGMFAMASAIAANK